MIDQVTVHNEYGNETAAVSRRHRAGNPHATSYWHVECFQCFEFERTAFPTMAAAWAVLAAHLDDCDGGSPDR